jgi:hypothetical protein
MGKFWTAIKNDGVVCTAGDFIGRKVKSDGEDSTNFVRGGVECWIEIIN